MHAELIRTSHADAHVPNPQRASVVWRVTTGDPYTTDVPSSHANGGVDMVNMLAANPPASAAQSVLRQRFRATATLGGKVRWQRAHFPLAEIRNAHALAQCHLSSSSFSLDFGAGNASANHHAQSSISACIHQKRRFSHSNSVAQRASRCV